MGTTPAKARRAVRAITLAMAEVQALENTDDSLSGTVYQHLVDARSALMRHAHNEPVSVPERS